MSYSLLMINYFSTNCRSIAIKPCLNWKEPQSPCHDKVWTLSCQEVHSLTALEGPRTSGDRKANGHSDGDPHQQIQRAHLPRLVARQLHDRRHVLAPHRVHRGETQSWDSDWRDSSGGLVCLKKKRRDGQTRHDFLLVRCKKRLFCCNFLCRRIGFSPVGWCSNPTKNTHWMRQIGKCDKFFVFLF